MTQSAAFLTWKTKPCTCSAWISIHPLIQLIDFRTVFHYWCNWFRGLFSLAGDMYSLSAFQFVYFFLCLLEIIFKVSCGLCVCAICHCPYFLPNHGLGHVEHTLSHTWWKELPPLRSDYPQCPSELIVKDVFRSVSCT